jgi:hypothetical protein
MRQYQTNPALNSQLFRVVLCKVVKGLQVKEIEMTGLSAGIRYNDPVSVSSLEGIIQDFVTAGNLNLLIQTLKVTMT